MIPFFVFSMFGLYCLSEYLSPNPSSSQVSPLRHFTSFFQSLTVAQGAVGKLSLKTQLGMLESGDDFCGLQSEVV